MLGVALTKTCSSTEFALNLTAFMSRMLTSGGNVSMPHSSHHQSNHRSRGNLDGLPARMQLDFTRAFRLPSRRD
jgi:hypothetical protein